MHNFCSFKIRYITQTEGLPSQELLESAIPGKRDRYFKKVINSSGMQQWLLKVNHIFCWLTLHQRVILYRQKSEKRNDFPHKFKFSGELRKY